MDTTSVIHCYMTSFESVHLTSSFGKWLEELKEVASLDGRTTPVKEARSKLRKVEDALCTLSELSWELGNESIMELFET